MRRLLPRLTVVTLGASLVLLGGCIGGKTQPSRFYILTALPSSEPGKQSAEHRIAIGIGPVELPEYLNRPQIVTRANRNQLHLAEFDQWAEPLKDNFSRVLAENLSVLLSTEHVAIFPWDGSTPIDYQVAVEVTRFEGTTGGGTSLIARWSIFGKGGRELLLRRRSCFSEPGGAKDYDATVSAMNRTLADLSREIAAEIKAISQKAPDH